MEISVAKKNQIEMLGRFFNIKANAHCWYNSPKTQEAASKAIDAANGDIAEIKAFLRTRIEAGEMDFRKACLDFVETKPVEVVFEEVKEEVEVKEEPRPVPQIDNLTASMNFMGQVVTELLAKPRWKRFATPWALLSERMFRSSLLITTGR